MRIQDIARTNHGFLVIAEAKPVSPFGWRAGRSWDDLFRIAVRAGDVVSVHTDSRWGGSVDLVREARARTTKPILAKGIHASDDQIRAALAAGADFALVVGRLPAEDLRPRCLIEPNSVGELAALPLGTAAVWNSRDLATGGLKPDGFTAARSAWEGWLCQASNVASLRDVDPSANAVLVGQGLPGFAAEMGVI